jgi:O-antigen/teichoic acid export membrane protein
MFDRTSKRTTQSPLSPGISSIITNTLYILSGQGVQFSVRFLYAIILARFLGPHDYGLIAYGTSLYIAVLPLTKLGIEHVVIRVLGYDKTKGTELLRSSLPMRRTAAFLSALLFCLATTLWENDPQTRLILALFSLALLGRSFAQWNLALFTAYESNRFSFRLQAIFRPLEVALGLLALALWRNPLAVVLVHASIWWMEAIFGAAMLRKHFTIPRGRWNLAHFKPILAESLPMCLAMTLVSVMSQGPLLAFKHIGGTGMAAGNVALAMQVFTILAQLPIAASSASYPVLSRAIARGDGKEVLFVETMMRVIIFLGTALALLGMTLGPPVTIIVFGEKYAEAGRLVGTTLWMMIPWAAMNSLMRVQTARRKIRSTLSFLAAGVLVFILGSKPAVDIFGMQGTVLAGLAGMCVITSCLFVAVARHGDINIGLAAARPLGALSVSAFACHMLLSHIDPWAALLASWSVLGVSWLAFGCMSRREIEALTGIWRNRRDI